MTERIARLPKPVIVSFTLLVSGVWLYHGLINKLLAASPRHLLIIQSVPGLNGNVGQVALFAIGAFEVAIAIWLLSRRALFPCAIVQSIVLLSMNVVELTYARAYLIWPAGLIPLNLAFLASTWIIAISQRSRLTESLRSHPIPIVAHFDHTLVLTYAFPEALLKPLIPRGLELDTYDGYAFLAIAMVQTRSLRPAFMPRALGRDFFLTGYRIFTRFHHDHRTRRGLRILRSDADSQLMVRAGNRLTHYNYQLCRSTIHRSGSRLEIQIETPGRAADLHVIADLECESETQTLPAGSPFKTLHEARRFAGPLPWTFDYEPGTHSIIAIKGVRDSWQPRLVPVEVRNATFLDAPPFNQVKPRLASAFYVHDTPYRWNRGIRFPLSKEVHS